MLYAPCMHGLDCNSTCILYSYIAKVLHTVHVVCIYHGQSIDPFDLKEPR